MLDDLKKSVYKTDKGLDWIDENADLIDTDLVSFFVKLANETGSYEQVFVSSFLIDPDGAGFTKKEVLGIIVNDYKIGKWDGLDDWNKDCATNGALSSTNVKRALFNVLSNFNGNIYSSTYPDVTVSDLKAAGVEYLSYIDSRGSLPVIRPIQGFKYKSTISDFHNYCQQQDLYVAVERHPDMPESWQNNITTIPQRFSMFDSDCVRTVTSKNTLYLKPRANTQSKWSDHPFIMVSINHLAKAGSTTTIPCATIPKKIVDKYGLPVVDY